jgi:hypothetical protein
MIDLDDAPVELPKDWTERPEQAVRYVIRHCLPEAFHEAGVVVQWSSKMTPDLTTPKAHLFFLLSRPTWSAELLHWLAGWPVDRAMFNPSQCHFVANPEVLDSDGNRLPDPLGDDRVMTFDGPPVEVPDHIEQSAVLGSRRVRNGSGEWSSEFEDFEARLAALCDDGVLAVHDQLCSLALAYVTRTYPNHSLEKLKAMVVEHLVFRHGRPQAEIEHRLGYDLKRSFDSAVYIVESERVEGSRRFKRWLSSSDTNPPRR